MTEVKDRDLYTRGDQQMEHRLGAEKAGNQTKTREGTRSATQENNQWQMRKIRTIRERENRSGEGGKKIKLTHKGRKKTKLKQEMTKPNAKFPENKNKRRQ